MSAHLTILTGHSRGLGLALAEQLLATGHTVLGISRQRSPGLDQAAQAASGELIEWQADLADGAPVAQQLMAWLQARAAAPWQTVNLINNACMLPAIAPLSKSDPADLARALRVGLETPMQLCAAFLQATASWNAARKIMNISSALGRRAMASQSAYCAA